VLFTFELLQLNPQS